MKKPTIVCLCGSTRFRKTFEDQNIKLTMQGKVVLAPGVFFRDTGQQLTTYEKEALDELHKRKIDLSDEVLILNVGGYIGDSTRSEMVYAIENHKPVFFLEEVNP